MIGAALVVGQALVAGCSPAEEMLPSAEVTVSGSAGPADSPSDGIGTDVQQQVKNLCLEELQAEAAGETPKPGQLKTTKVRLGSVKYLGEVRHTSLPDGAAGYELGIEFAFKIGNDDPKTGRKICSVNLADSSVTWQP